MTLSLAILFILISGWFTGLEIALLQTDKVELSNNTKEDSGFKNLFDWMSNSSKLFTTILLSINFSNQIAAAIFSYFIYVNLLTDERVYLNLIFTVVILIFAEGLPKMWAIRSSNVFIKGANASLKVSNYLLAPFITFFSFLPKRMKMDSKGLIRVYKIQRKEIINITDRAMEEKIMTDEVKRIRGVLSLGEKTVRSCIVPKDEITVLGPDMKLDDVVDVIKKTGHSRIPFCFNDLDDSRTYLHAKSLFKLKKEEDWKTVLKPLVRLKSNTYLDDAMDSMKKGGGIAIVETKTQTLGVVFLEDILEFAVGKTADEYDEKLN
ncbi:hypothetical protein CL659_05630 [bacterium]|nr:hypothetical protein [bacterium]|tara:strand:- start:11625 stop:12587 length:963 start_codon:yes stop_codon:yes gene_type:complete